MDSSKLITLALNGTFNDEPISPTNISARVLLKFVKAAGKFVAGKSAWLDRSIQIGEGSLEVAQESFAGDESIWSDFSALQSGNEYAVSKFRRDALDSVKSIAQSVDKGRVLVRYDKLVILEIEGLQAKQAPEDDWYPVERWMLGSIDRAGGAQPMLWLHASGVPKVRISASAELLSQEKENFLYHERLLHIGAEQNFKTGALRRHRLIAFTGYNPNVSSEAMAAFVEEGTKAWADVPDTDAWLSELRGH